VAEGRAANVSGYVAHALEERAKLDDLASLLDDHAARAAGQLCGITGTSDMVDASVAVAARDRQARVITSDPDDIRHLDHSADIFPV